MSTQMPTYLYSPNTAARAREAVTAASRKVTKCQTRVDYSTGSDRREATRALRTAQRALATAQDRLARAEDPRTDGVTL